MYNNEDEDSCANFLSDKNYQATSKKFQQTDFTTLYIYIYISILQSSKSEVGNNSVRTNKLFKFQIFIYSW